MLSQVPSRPGPFPQAGDEAGRIDVIAGVLRDARGRILLARRTEGRDLAGLWEFPGGKREPGETPQAALVRELHEELGIDATIGDALICVAHRYPHKRLRLDVRHISHWRGTPKGREGQALAWVPRDKLPGYAMPAADRPVVAALLQADRYLVTPVPQDGVTWLEALRRALMAGIRRVQLRAPGYDATRWRALVVQAVDCCRAHGAEVLVNGDIALARELGIGVHLRGVQLQQLHKRPLPRRMPVAASCHGVDELARAGEIDCDFAVLGPVRATATHPDAAAMGWNAFARRREQSALPIYAIGGMGVDDIAAARAHGAQGIAAIRGLWCQVESGRQPSDRL